MNKRLVSCLAFCLISCSLSLEAQRREAVPLEEYLRGTAVDRSVIDYFLDPTSLSWAQYHPDVGYILGNYLPHDGIDESSTISTVQSTGARTSHLYPNKKCRINTYGNSFTQCHQVSDGETWQEYLAAHLGEPIRNFGMGGFGVYQAYRRMLSEEKTENDAEYIILYIWGDDHLRSLLRCRHALIYKWWDHAGGKLFHNNFWANVEINLRTGQIEEKENRLPTPESLYKMTDPEWMYQNLKDDLALNMYLFARGLTNELDWHKVDQLSELLQLPRPDRTTPELARRSVMNTLLKYGYTATKYILAKAREFTCRSGKKLLVVLNDPRGLRRIVETGTRTDQEIVDFLETEKFNYFDMNLVHVEDFKIFNFPFSDYLKRYFMPHYNPAGNHFFAYSIKEKIVDWLNPKPLPYRDTEEAFVDFTGYVDH